MNYEEFIQSKSQLDGRFGFEPLFTLDALFPFQKFLTDWAVQKGRAAIFADCGLGKTPMELAWAQNMHLKTGKPTLIITPLAVASQFVREGEKFGLEVSRSIRGEIKSPIAVTNYERLKFFSPENFGAVVCDESSILKNFDGTRKAEITQFMRLHKYRLLATATAAPNDYPELGTSSEALGYLGYMDMLGRFFTNRQKTTHQYHGKYKLKNNDKWRFKGHAEQNFWRWITSWARALRKPSDLGFDDNGFILPELEIIRHMVKPQSPPPGMLFTLPAVGLREQGQETRRTVRERCEMAAGIVAGTGKPAVVWCHLNDEGDLLQELIPDSRQVSGKDSDAAKEEKFEAFTNGDLRVLITKPKIGAWGLNWQHCAHTVYFPSNSYEQYYQAVRRFYRFGQTEKVRVDTVGTSGELHIMKNMERKEQQAITMFESLIQHMNNSLSIQRLNEYTKEMTVPSWL